MTQQMVDDVTISQCLDCSETFVVVDGWEGRCPSCNALGDDHRDGLHQGRFVEACHDCREVEDRQLRATA